MMSTDPDNVEGTSIVNSVGGAVAGLRDGSSSLLRTMSPIPFLFGTSNKSRNNKSLTSKEKKYFANVEKALSYFESVDEWADYISYLTRLQKTIQSYRPEETRWIPKDFEIAKTLSKCLSPKLPSGVHRKGLEVYSVIFDILGEANLGNDINIWLPGLLPLMPYASITVKPEILGLFSKYIATLDPSIIRVILKSVLLSLLSGLDDTTSESFGPTVELIDSFKTHLKDDSHFWQCLFLSIITSPDKRTGAMEWCIKKLPSFTVIEEEGDTQQTLISISSKSTTAGGTLALDSTDIWNNKQEKEKILKGLSDDAKACVSPEPGLLIRAFAEGLNDENVFVQRGFFDLLISRLHLDSPVLQVLASNGDKELLILAASKTVLRKDMSINRRLWNWLLGPETETSPSKSHRNSLSIEKAESEIETIIEAPLPKQLSRLEYFQLYGLNLFTSALLGLVESTDPSKANINRSVASRICIALMDRWEIGQLVVPKLLTPIFEASKKAVDDAEKHSELSTLKLTIDQDEDKTTQEVLEVLRSANSFVDSIEAINIYSEVYSCVQNDNAELLFFILKNFHVEEEDMVVNHMPLILLAIIVKQGLSVSKDSKILTHLMKSLINSIPARAFLPLEHSRSQYSDPAVIGKNFEEFKTFITGKIGTFYNLESEEEVKNMPFETADLTAIILSSMVYVISEMFSTDPSGIFAYCELLKELFDRIPTTSQSNYKTDILLAKLQDEFACKEMTESDVPVAFGISIIFHSLVKNMQTFDKLKYLGIVINSLWYCLIHPSGLYQVEAVRSICRLDVTCDPCHIEAALSSLFLKSDYFTRIRAFNCLWTHISAINESDIILVRPLQLILDDLNGLDEISSIAVSKWIKTVLHSGSINRIFKVCCNGILVDNPFITRGTSEEDDEDDYDLFSYKIETIYNLLSIDKESLVPVFRLEMCVFDSDAEIAIVKDNAWNVSSYKSLIFAIIRRFLSKIEKLSSERDIQTINSVSRCMKKCLKLLDILIDGSELELSDLSQLLCVLCQKFSQSDIPEEAVISSSLFSTLSLIVKISSKKSLNIKLFETPSYEGSCDFTTFIQRGLSLTRSHVVFSSWIDFILLTSEYYPELIFRATFKLVCTICDKVNSLSTINQNNIHQLDENLKNDHITEVDVAQVDQTICDLLTGLEQLVSSSHTYLTRYGGKLDGNDYLFGSSRSNTEAGFFGTVMQGVFQVESPTDRDEQLSRRLMILRSLKLSVLTSYVIWTWADKNSKIRNSSGLDISTGSRDRVSSIVELSQSFNHGSPNMESQKTHLDFKLASENITPDLLLFSKSINYNANKLKFRAKKLLEKMYELETIETLETFIGSDNDIEANSSTSVFKLLHVLDGSRSEQTLPYLIDSLISRVNISSLETKDRSSLLTQLTDRRISNFLVRYVLSLSSDSMEDIWSQVLHFLKEVNSNSSLYKLLYPEILKFAAIVAIKIFKTSFGEQKKIRKEITDIFIKLLNASVTAKYSDENGSSSLFTPINITPADGQISNEGSIAETKSVDTSSVTFNETKISSGDITNAHNQHSAKSLATNNSNRDAAIKDELCGSLVTIIPNLRLIIYEEDKAISCFSTIVNSIAVPAFKSSPFTSTPRYVLDLLIALSESPLSAYSKSWKSLCFDGILMDSKFFSIKFNSLPLWNKVIYSWIYNDKEKVSGIVSRIVAPTSNSTLFNWNDSEITNRVLSIKRATYVLMILPTDSLLVKFKDFENKIYEVLSLSNTSLRAEVFILLRALVLRFTEQHLVDLWITIYTGIQTVLYDILAKVSSFKTDGKETLSSQRKQEIGSTHRSSDNEPTQFPDIDIDNYLVLQVCKLLDVLLMLKPEEFQLSEWLFISETTDAIYRDSKTPILGLIDQLSNLKEMRASVASVEITSAIALANRDSNRVPLLEGIKKFEKLSDLKEFFHILSINNYESCYNKKSIAVNRCISDVFEDLFE
ncbi:hypothetical protein B5S33_g3734 [[Candida] boidinii]|nr:hypothetical protein B5S33_g3734 [[Candida] boidinii]